MKKNAVRTLLWGVLGASAGYAYYHFIGCASGTCPITGNPWLMTAYGTFMGVTLGWPKKPVPEKTSDSTSDREARKP